MTESVASPEDTGGHRDVADGVGGVSFRPTPSFPAGRAAEAQLRALGWAAWPAGALSAVPCGSACVEAPGTFVGAWLWPFEQPPTPCSGLALKPPGPGLLSTPLPESRSGVSPGALVSKQYLGVSQAAERLGRRAIC